VPRALSLRSGETVQCWFHAPDSFRRRAVQRKVHYQDVVLFRDADQHKHADVALKIGLGMKKQQCQEHAYGSHDEEQDTAF
jgi:hypothetical protein